MNIQEHVIAALRGAPRHKEPFPWFFAENVFPSDFYAHLQDVLAKKEDFHTEKFANRTFANSPLDPALDFMASNEFFHEMLRLFSEELVADYGGKKATFTRDVRLIRDNQGYKIGPHTDAPWKVLSLLFYLPPDDSMKEYGTAIYVPKNKSFRCPGGPHYSFEHFDMVDRVPFLPNTCLGFWKTDHSFHGVPPIAGVVRRDVLLYNIYRESHTLTSLEPHREPRQDRIRGPVP